MITLQVTEADIKQAKEETAKFDKIKTWNKVACNHNWIGVLGERLMHRHLMKNKVDHDWVDFVKEGWTEPDFYIDEHTIDLKTTYTMDGMIVSQIKWDIYIYAQMSRDNTKLYIKGWVPKDMLLDNSEEIFFHRPGNKTTKPTLPGITGKAKKAYFIRESAMLPIETLKAFK